MKLGLCFGLALVVLLPPSIASAAEPQPGDACPATDQVTHTGGPENPGTGYDLVCDGAHWQAVRTWASASGRSLFQVDNDAGSCTASKLGRLRYDGVSTWAYCNGSSWTSLLAGSSAAWSSLTNPSANLALSMAAYTSTFTYGATTGTSDLFKLTDTASNTGTGYLLNVATATGSTEKPFHVGAVGTDALTVLANGNVGIGTTTPLGKLSVLSSAGVQAVKVTQNSLYNSEAYAGVAINSTDLDTGVLLGADNTNHVAYIQSLQPSVSYATRKLSINPNGGNVGIGTTSPAALLHVAGEVIIGSTGLACSATTAGAQRYNATTLAMEYCNGTAWGGIATTPSAPNAFSFTDQSGVNLSTTITSNTVTLSGYAGSLTATCSGCTAIARNGSWGGTTVAGFNAGDTIAIRVTSSASAGTAVTATVTVGATTSGTWTVTTNATTPGAFSFTNVTGATTGITYSSNAVTLSGFTGTLTATCNNCTGIAHNGVWGVSPYSGFASGDTIAIRQTSSAGLGTATTANVTVGATTSGTWTVTTTSGCQTGITVGQTCPDGTIYAGFSPDGNVPMYTTPCDAGQYWNGSSCTACGSGLWSGSGTSCSTTYASNNYPAWNNGTTNWTVTGYTSATTGKANTAGLEALADAGAPYKAADYCYNLPAFSHSDWYLPAQNELNVMYGNETALQHFDTTDGSTPVGGAYPGLYWTSTENVNDYAWYQRFSDGNQFSTSKYILLSVRCVRR
jgi:hypothetical protein